MQAKKQRKTLTQRQWTLIGAFLTPVIIMTAYFAYRQMAPFGSSSLLTVDLGQQYVDFFAYLRRAILHHPSTIFYSFSNGLGGEMVGNWAYYLLSPLNWLLLLFPGGSLTSGILLITVLKYGLAGLSFAWLQTKLTPQTGGIAVALSTAYAMMGWTIANQLNIMWLDALVLLPLIFYGLHQLLLHNKWRAYLIWLPLMLIINYYMAYMICLFLILAFFWLTVDHFSTWKALAAQAGRFALGSLISGALAAVVLLPTLWSLSQSKAQYTVTSFKWKFEFFPPKMIAKFFMGAFNFDQMPDGTANLFVGAIALLGALFFFVDRRQRLRSRITAGLITLFLAASLCVQTAGPPLARGTIPRLVPLPILLHCRVLADLAGGPNLYQGLRPGTHRYWYRDRHRRRGVSLRRSKSEKIHVPSDQRLLARRPLRGSGLDALHIAHQTSLDLPPDRLRDWGH